MAKVALVLYENWGNIAAMVVMFASGFFVGWLTKGLEEISA